MSRDPHIYNVILAGGGGSRLWPKSRGDTPKQFLKLFGNRTMIQHTADRALKLVDWDHIVVVANKDHLPQIKKQLPELPEANLIAEPEKKDTALAMFAGALYVNCLDPEAVVVNSAADHLVTNEDKYIEVMEAAVQAARTSDYLVCVGIAPTLPATGFGYIKSGQKLFTVKPNISVFEVDSFTEKPDKATAQAFIATGKYFWNANMYVWSTQAIIKAFEKYQVKTFELVKPLLENKNCAKFASFLPEIYRQAEAISIDYAISEKADNLVLVPGDLDWSDIGDWRVVHNLNPKDIFGNTKLEKSDPTELLTLDAKNNMVDSDRKMVALLGVENLIIVDTPEILMVTTLDKSQEVKKIVEKLKADSKKQYL